MWLAVVGVAIVLVAASATMRFVSAIPHVVGADDPITYITITSANADSRPACLLFAITPAGRN
jgi:hypothetical protein